MRDLRFQCSMHVVAVHDHRGRVRSLLAGLMLPAELAGFGNAGRKRAVA